MAKKYTLSDLLVGQRHYSLSRHIDGVITSARPRPEIYYGEGLEPYLIGFRDKGGTGFKLHYATIAVKVGE